MFGNNAMGNRLLPRVFGVDGIRLRRSHANTPGLLGLIHATRRFKLPLIAARAFGLRLYFLVHFALSFGVGVLVLRDNYSP